MSGWGLRTQPPWMERVRAGPGKGGARQNGGTPAGMQGQDIEREVAENEGPLLSERLDRVPTLPPSTRCATLGKLLSLSVARFPSLFKSTGANNDSSLPGGCKD